jgi:chemotaxis protein CheC
MRRLDGGAAEAALVLPQPDGFALVRRMLALPGDSGERTELEQDALAEVGNIVIDACSSVLASTFGWDIEAVQPRVTLSYPDRPVGAGEALGNALVTYLCMHLSGLRVDGLVVLEMSGIAGLPQLPPLRLDA